MIKVVNTWIHASVQTRLQIIEFLVNFKIFFRHWTLLKKKL
jgi:hypothetical protein